MPQPDLLVVQNLSIAFGGLKAVDDMSLTIRRGSVAGLIGPNGAGKSTLFNLIAGYYQPDSGRVMLDGEDITGQPPHLLFGKGLLRTFQIAREFSTLTARENLMMVPAGQSGETWLGALLRPGRVRREERALREKADDILDFLQITSIADLPAGSLSGGQKKLLELGRTMMADPKIIFLDEVGAGVNRTLLYTIADAIRRLNRERGYTFCLVEHDMQFIAELCDEVTCMAQGRLLSRGTAESILSDEAVIEAYLGRGRAAKGTGLAGTRVETMP
ncbi:ABC transporter ATP-binding protein [Tabrizicola oligotrophica]|uniref:ABC transporter ATP-binding protein n=1 Tax=Tabrizicola oligotrophica TaxID=2710650 RepID=A0A6M0QXC2_9RHOB|nr:ABC transporter ATP-binding protein [Tabrizicola oligotrophica]NEY92037.1 ABC transporter ATP-binding protein [Tabrizicola oligotrophica]